MAATTQVAFLSIPPQPQTEDIGPDTGLRFRRSGPGTSYALSVRQHGRSLVRPQFTASIGRRPATPPTANPAANTRDDVQKQAQRQTRYHLRAAVNWLAGFYWPFAYAPQTTTRLRHNKPTQN